MRTGHRTAPRSRPGVELVARGPAPRRPAPAATPACRPAASASAAPGTDGQLAPDRPRPRPRARARGPAPASAAAGTRYGATSAATLGRATLGGQLGQRPPGRAEGGHHRRVGVGLGRRQRWRRARRAAHPVAEHRGGAERGQAAGGPARAARPARARARRAATPRSSPSDGERRRRGRVAVAAPGRSTARSRTPAARPATSSGWRASRESGVPCRYTTGTPPGSPTSSKARVRPSGSSIRRRPTSAP